jgi:AraC-like DNA-binding protein
MKPIFQRLTAEPEEGFAFKELCGTGFNCPWHVHREHELILMEEGSGYRIVGDKTAVLEPGDMVFVGPGLPHIWQEEPRGAGRTRTLLIQFDERFLGDGLLKLPALGAVRRLLLRARRGLQVVGTTRDKASVIIREMAASAGLERIRQFLAVLDLLSDSKECVPIASPGFAAKFQTYDQARMDRVYQYLTSRLGEQLRIEQVAQHAHLSHGAFSRFFKAHTGNTFPEFVNTLRIGRACRLLTDGEKSITEVAYACGFSNLSNFNRQFLRLKGSTPREFRRQMILRISAQP